MASHRESRAIAQPPEYLFDIVADVERYPEFLPLVMQTEAFHAHAIKQSKGSVNPYINFTDLVWFEFALPPMDEQRRFAALLRAATRSSEALEEALHAARRVVQAFKDNLLQSHAPKQCQICSLANLLVGSPESGCSAQPQDADTGYFEPLAKLPRCELLRRSIRSPGAIFVASEACPAERLT